MSKRRKPSARKRKRRATRQREISAQRRRDDETLEDYANPQPFSWPRNAPVVQDDYYNIAISAKSIKPKDDSAPPATAPMQTPGPEPTPTPAGDPLDYLGEDKFVTATAIVIAIVWIVLIALIAFPLIIK